MNLPIRAYCNGCGRVIEAGEEVLVEISGGGWNAFRHPACRRKPALLPAFEMDLLEADA